MLRSSQKAYDEAAARAAEAAALIEKLRSAKSRAAAVAVENQLREFVSPGIYEHFKSSPEKQHLYAVSAVLFDVSGVFGPFVEYAALYQSDEWEEGVRVLYDAQEGFLNPVEKDEYQGSRFRLLYPLGRFELQTLIERMKLFPFSDDREAALRVIEGLHPDLKKKNGK